MTHFFTVSLIEAMFFYLFLQYYSFFRFVLYFYPFKFCYFFFFIFFLFFNFTLCVLFAFTYDDHLYSYRSYALNLYCHCLQRNNRWSIHNTKSVLILYSFIIIYWAPSVCISLSIANCELDGCYQLDLYWISILKELEVDFRLTYKYEIVIECIICCEINRCMALFRYTSSHFMNEFIIFMIELLIG